MPSGLAKYQRIQTIDAIRGLVMIIMAIDHVRDIAGNAIIATTPTNLKTTTTALFFTRWITHLCAPTFVFLSGTSAFLSVKNSQDLNKTRLFLLKRGAWLVLVNFTINNFAIFFDIHFGVLFSQVIAAIGFGLIGVALLLKLSIRVITALALVIIFGHDLFTGITFGQGGPTSMAWTFLMNAGFFQLSSHRALLMSYPVIPWLGVMLAGFAFGSLFDLTLEKRKKICLGIGLSALVLFVIIRAFNFYGDPARWSVQPTRLFTFLSFINASKYPPSLLFILMTLGISVSMLSIVDGLNSRITGIVSVYGKVPLFYWLLHWFIIHFVAIGIFLCQGYRWADLQFTGFSMGHPSSGGGLDLTGLYIAWAAVVLFLYPICGWYGKYKLEHREKKWLKYL